MAVGDGLGGFVGLGFRGVRVVVGLVESSGVVVGMLGPLAFGVGFPFEPTFGVVVVVGGLAAGIGPDFVGLAVVFVVLVAPDDDVVAVGDGEQVVAVVVAVADGVAVGVGLQDDPAQGVVVGFAGAGSLVVVWLGGFDGVAGGIVTVAGGQGLLTLWCFEGLGALADAVAEVVFEVFAVGRVVDGDGLAERGLVVVVVQRDGVAGRVGDGFQVAVGVVGQAGGVAVLVDMGGQAVGAIVVVGLFVLRVIAALDQPAALVIDEVGGVLVGVRDWRWGRSGLATANARCRYRGSSSRRRWGRIGGRRVCGCVRGSASAASGRGAI